MLCGESMVVKMRKKTAALICRVLGVLILGCVILSCLPVTVPQIMGYRAYNVVSGSMEPALPVGSLIYVAKVQPETVQQQDMVAFWRDGTVVTHRVVENDLAQEAFVTKGDANAENDMTPVPYGNLIGKVAYHVPFMGALSILYSSGKGKVYLLCFALCGALLNLLASRLGRREEAE